MKKLSVVSACLICVSSLVQADNSYKFIGIGLGNNSYLADSQKIKYSPALNPSIIAGVGYHFDINKDYSVDSELSIDYTQINYSQIDFTQQYGKGAVFELSHENNTATSFNISSLNKNGKVEAIGLWATARLNRHNLFSTSFAEVSPFVELSVGTVNLNSNNNVLFKDDRITAYKAVTGLKFNFTNDTSFSLGFGVANKQMVNAL